MADTEIGAILRMAQRKRYKLLASEVIEDAKNGKKVFLDAKSNRIIIEEDDEGKMIWKGAMEILGY